MEYHIWGPSKNRAKRFDLSSMPMTVMTRMAFATVLLVVSSVDCFAGSGDSIEGVWSCRLKSPGGPIQFDLELKRTGKFWSGYLVNGPERIKIPSVTLDETNLCLDIDHYDSRIVAQYLADQDVLIGHWEKRRGPDEWVKMEFKSVRPATLNGPPGLVVDTKTGKDLDREIMIRNQKPFVGKWSVKFSSSDDPAVALIDTYGSHKLLATFLTTTGDYRYLSGLGTGNQMTVSCFDGAHAFLFRATLQKDGSLKGDFWSSNTWHEQWTATPNAKATMPDAFLQTKMIKGVDWGRLSFPDLQGKPTRLDDPEFAGKVRIIYVFGSWCPNCHDAAEYFAGLQEKYRDQGLSILGLAFELTGDFSRDSKQVGLYLKRHKAEYPVLIAGLSDKEQASRAIPLLDRVRSYPTTLFLDRENQVRAIHTGFSGPATGKAHAELQSKFEALIEKLLQE